MCKTSRILRTLVVSTVLLALPGPAVAQRSTVQFINNANTTVEVYWLDNDGNKQLYQQLAPGQSYTQVTNVSDPLVVIDKTTGQTLLEVTATAQPQVANITKSPAAAGQQASGGDISGTLVQLHNRYRASHCASPVSWSVQIAHQAQQWARTLQSNNCEMSHSSGSAENLAGVDNNNPDLADAVARWYNEVDEYDFSSPQRASDQQYYMTVGHFMNVVWKGTTEIGCALALCPGRSQWGVLVCQYNRTGQDWSNATNVEDCR